ncbi:MAG TPA: aminodeoxychorismate/anthranilate synthase component II [Microscillaceae bacterium]|jgi:anthranilate synthase component 2|nr:aminodeoxychorismate/anthranilate synthase component II [Microscillaceae bacterium]
MKNPILVIDNYDSFVYNLVHIIQALGYEVVVCRNDKLTLPEVAAYSHILLSPGPGIPSEAGLMMDIIKQYAPEKSILGVCLGHQAIAEVFGATLYNLPDVLHGVSSTNQVTDPTAKIFQGIPATFQVAHYHSWAVEKVSVKQPLVITAQNPEGMVMGLRHQTYEVYGVQFHPESIMTEHGKQLIANWLTL